MRQQEADRVRPHFVAEGTDCTIWLVPRLPAARQTYQHFYQSQVTVPREEWNETDVALVIALRLCSLTQLFRGFNG